MPVAVPLLFLLFSECWARLVNVTIDDTYGDARTGAIASYAPAGQWGPVTSSSRDVQNGTLRCPDGNGNLTLTFEGTLIYVFFVFPDEDRDTPINVASYLNGESQPSGRYSRQSNVSDGGPPKYLYNVLVFQSTPLPPRKHTLTVTIEAWLSYFDYALYTVDDVTVDPPQESGPASVVPPHSAGVPVSQSPSGSGSLTISNAQTETAPSEPGTLPSATLLPLSSATETLGKDTSSDSPHRSHAPRNRPALIAGPVAAAVVLIGLLVCFCVWRRRRSVAAARRSSSDGTVSRFVPPPAAPDTSESIATTSDKTTRPRASTNASTRIRDNTSVTPVMPFIAQPDPAPAESEKQSRRAAIIAKQNIPSALRVGTGGFSTPRTHAPVDIGAELERMLAQNARAREEIEMLRQAVEPPPYSHSQRGTGVERLGNALS